jgi:hypothetical protein
MLVLHIFARLCNWTQLPNDSAGDRGGIAQVMGPKADDTPTRSPERLCADPISFDIVLQFWKPISLVARWLATMLRASVPEAAVHENYETLAAKHEIRAARQGLVSAPAGNPVRAEDGDEFEFRLLVSPGTNLGHHSRSLLFRENVWHRSNSFYQTAARKAR